jgi:hypothetical protein
MDIIITLVLGICTLTLAILGIYASVRPPQTMRGSRNILKCSIIFGLIGLICVVWQSIRANNQQAKLEQAVQEQNRLSQEHQKILKKSLDDMNAQLTLVNNSPDFDLRKRALLLPKDILQFLIERRAGEPPLTYPSGENQEEMYEKEEKRSAYSNQTQIQFLEKFAVRWEATLKELRTRGINISYLESAQFASTNRLSIENSAIKLGALALQIPEAK